ncbi:MAG: UDP-N-acetylmuramate--L-alanine ligase [Actinomycetes bacterium]
MPGLERGPRTVHLVGVGGAGMSGLARLLLAAGHRVTGSDRSESATLEALRALGAEVWAGHDGARLGRPDLVVASTAIRPANPELVAARILGVPVLGRAQLLALLMAGKVGIAVAGTHGKTTTTGMVVAILEAAGLDPSFAVGGDFKTSGINAAAGTGPHFVAEADESDGSFLLYRPEIAIITNVEPDHLDHYGSVAAVEAAFEEFCRRVLPGGLVVACGDDPGVREVVGRVAADLVARDVQVRFYGTGPDNDVRLIDLELTPDGVRFGLREQGSAGSEALTVGPLTLRVPGAHNALNAAAAWTVSRYLGVDGAQALAALATFGGTRRRFEAKGEAAGVRVVDDYSHHPTEVAAALASARSVVGSGRVIAVFQPHLFSRTRIFATDFGAALSLADRVAVLDVYAAREDPEPGVTGELITDQVRLPAADVAFCPEPADAVAAVVGWARPGDLVLTIGAGDVTALGPQILRALPGSTT